MFETGMMLQRMVGCGLTLYMVALCLRWVGPYIEVNLEKGVLRPVVRLTDPLIQLMRDLLKKIGPMGPVDWGPVAALMAVWIVRIVLVQY